MLGPALDGLVVDATVGAGGHAARLLDASPRARVLGLDRDPAAVEIARRRLAPYGDRARVVVGNFQDLAPLVQQEQETEAAAVLFDLGLSSLQLDDPARGFSFSREGPLDMRMGPDAPRTAAELLARTKEADLADVIARFGEEPGARRIARRLIERAREGRLATTTDLAAAAAGVVRGGRATHPATRIFQALRIAVNGELDALASALPQALGLLRKGGRLAAISFHSLEDRIVKQFLARESRDCVCPPEMPVCRCGHVKTVAILTRKPVTPSEEEARANPRARSAKLRAAERR